MAKKNYLVFARKYNHKYPKGTRVEVQRIAFKPYYSGGLAVKVKGIKSMLTIAWFV